MNILNKLIDVHTFRHWDRLMITPPARLSMRFNPNPSPDLIMEAVLRKIKSLQAKEINKEKK